MANATVKTEVHQVQVVTTKDVKKNTIVLSLTPVEAAVLKKICNRIGGPGHYNPNDCTPRGIMDDIKFALKGCIDTQLYNDVCGSILIDGIITMNGDLSEYKE